MSQDPHYTGRRAEDINISTCKALVGKSCELDEFGPFMSPLSPLLNPLPSNLPLKLFQFPSFMQ